MIQRFKDVHLCCESSLVFVVETRFLHYFDRNFRARHFVHGFLHDAVCALAERLAQFVIRAKVILEDLLLPTSLILAGFPPNNPSSTVGSSPGQCVWHDRPVAQLCMFLD